MGSAQGPTAALVIRDSWPCGTLFRSSLNNVHGQTGAYLPPLAAIR